MQHKYQYTCEKHDKAWGAIRDAIKTRGRNLRWNLKVQTIFRHGKDKDQEPLKYLIETILGKNLTVQ